MAPAVYAQDANYVSARIAAFSEGKAPESLDDLKTLQSRLQLLSKKLTPSTVNVRVGPAQGSGVIISEDGYILTAGHVCIKPGLDVVVTLSTGREVKAKSLGMNTKLDSGLMKITDPGKYPAVAWGDSSKLHSGQWVVCLGHPGGLEPGRPAVMRLGRVLSSDKSVVSTDCTLVGGDSGGPLFDLEGRVIGINSRIGGPLSVNLHVPTNEYRQTWDRLAASEEWGDDAERRPYIGVMGNPEAAEAILTEVYPGTPAADAGLQAGDVIVRFNGQPVADFASLAALVHKCEPGTEVKVEVRRKTSSTTNLGNQRELTLKLLVGGKSP